MEPEQSAIQMKCNGRVASSPPGRFFMFSTSCVFQADLVPQL
jgi:hypothetical protein